jgi:aryl-alcohol dehydrogenase-like predicted oxidoreductase
MGVIPWSPLGGGLLGGVLADRASGGRRGNDRMHEQVDANRSKLEAWEKLCAEIGAPPADVALAWLLQNPVVTAPIIGPRTVEQVDTAMGALDVELSDDVLDDLDRIFPGPGGAAPEAYAW